MKKLLTIFLFLCLTTSAFGQFFTPHQKPMLGLQVNWAHPQSKGLKFLMLGNEGSGNKVFDLSGNGNTGVFAGTLSWEAGKFGSAVDFPGPDDNYINCGNKEIIRMKNSSFSIVAWIKMDVADQFKVIIGNGLSGVAEQGFCLMTYTGGTGNLLCYINNIFKISNNSVIPNANEWYQVGLSFDQPTTTGTFYVNGLAVGSDNWGTYVEDDEADNMLIGADPRDGSLYEFAGGIDVVSLYNRALSASEFALLYREPFIMFKRDSIILWYTETTVYEDFTTYTEVDEGTNVTVAINKVSWVDLDLDETSYLYKDKTVDYFDGDFTHRFECQVSGRDAGDPIFAHWVIANAVGDLVALDGASEDFISFEYQYFGGVNLFSLVIYENGVDTFDDFLSPTDGVTYFIIIARDDDGGANNTGQMTAEIHTGAHHPNGVHVDLLSVDCSAGEQNDFRYIYGVCSADYGNAGEDASGYTERLLLSGIPPAAAAGQIIFINFF